MSELFPALQPITTEERQFIADVEGSMRPAFVNAVAEEFGPYGRPAAEVAEEMSAAAPGERLQTALEARMNSGKHFDALPAEERTAAAERAALAAAKSLNGKLVVETSDGRLGALAGKGADRLLRGQYESLAHNAGGEAGLVLGGAINRARFVHQLAETQRHAGAGVTPPGRRPETASTSATNTTDPAPAKPVDRTKPTHQPHTRG